MIKNIYKGIFWFLTICFTVQFIFILFQNPYLQNKYLNRGLVFFLMISFILLFIVVYSFFESRKQFFVFKHTIILLSVIFFLFFILQIFFVKRVYVNPTWDFGVVFRNVQAFVCDGKELAATQGDKIYFAKFGNNKGIVLFLSGILKFLQLMGFKINETNILGYCVIINCIFVQIALWLTSLIFVRLRKNYLAVYMSLIMIFSMVFLFYCPIFYTDTISLIIPLLLFHLILSYERHPYLRYILIMIIVTIIGYFLKLTSIFVLLAYIVFLFLKIKGELSFNKIKKISVLIVVGILFCLVLSPINSLMQRKMGITEELLQQYEIPYSHWIMMGMYEYKDFRVGGYFQEAYEYTEQFDTIDEKKKMNLEKMKQFIKERGVKGEISYLLRKGVFTWGDGLFFSLDLLSREQQHTEGIYQFLYDIENGHEKEFVSYYTAGFYYAILAYFIISLWSMLLRKRVTRFDIGRITIMGLYVFLMIWETTPRYLFHYLPFIYFLSTDSIAQIAKKISRRKRGSYGETS